MDRSTGRERKGVRRAKGGETPESNELRKNERRSKGKVGGEFGMKDGKEVRYERQEGKKKNDGTPGIRACREEKPKRASSNDRNMCGPGGIKL